MTTKCRGCSEDIDFKQSKAGKMYPVNLNGTFHECPARKSESNKSGPEASKYTPQKPQSRQTRWDGISKVEEVKQAQINEYLRNGWVILERVERVKFEPIDGQLREVTEAIYTVGIRK